MSRRRAARLGGPDLCQLMDGLCELMLTLRQLMLGLCQLTLDLCERCGPTSTQGDEGFGMCELVLGLRQVLLSLRQPVGGSGEGWTVAPVGRRSWRFWMAGVRGTFGNGGVLYSVARSKRA